LRRIFVLLLIALCSTIVACGNNSEQNIAEEKNIESRDINDYIQLKDEYDKSISAIAQDANAYLNTHDSFKDADELIDRAEKLENSIKKTLEEVSKLDDSSGKKDKLKKCFEYEFTRIDGLYCGMKKSAAGGDFLPDFKRGGEAAEAFKIANAEFTGSTNTKSELTVAVEDKQQSPITYRPPNQIPQNFPLEYRRHLISVVPTPIEYRDTKKLSDEKYYWYIYYDASSSKYDEFHNNGRAGYIIVVLEGATKQSLEADRAETSGGWQIFIPAYSNGNFELGYDEPLNYDNPFHRILWQAMAKYIYMTEGQRLINNSKDLLGNENLNDFYNR